MNPYPRRLIVNTVFRSKPYPQWVASTEGDHLLLDAIGYGDTESEAVRELYDVINDRENDDQERWQCETGIQS